MLSDAATPEAYLDALEDDWRRGTLLALRTLVLAHRPAVEETIHYNMPGYGANGDFVFHLNAQKGYVSLYVGDIAKIASGGALLKGLNLGKGCIRFSKSTRVEETGVAAFIDRAVDLWRQGADVAC